MWAEGEAIGGGLRDSGDEQTGYPLFEWLLPSQDSLLWQEVRE